MKIRGLIIRVVLLYIVATTLYDLFEPRLLYPGDFYFHQAKIQDNFSEIEGVYTEDYYRDYPDIFHKVSRIFLSVFPSSYLQFSYRYVFIIMPFISYLISGISFTLLFATNTLYYFIHSGTLVQLFIMPFFIVMADDKKEDMMDFPSGNPSHRFSFGESIVYRLLSALTIALSHSAGIYIVGLYLISRILQELIDLKDDSLKAFIIISLINPRRALYYSLLAIPTYSLIKYLKSGDEKLMTFLSFYAVGLLPITPQLDFIDRALLFSNFIFLTSKRKIKKREYMTLPIYGIIQMMIASRWIPSYTLNYNPKDIMPSLKKVIRFP